MTMVTSAVGNHWQVTFLKMMPFSIVSVQLVSRFIKTAKSEANRGAASEM